MPYVLSVAPHGGPRGRDGSPDLLHRLSGTATARVRFDRTEGGEAYGVIDDAGQAVDAVLQVLRLGGLSVGLGAGGLHGPSQDGRSGAGPAYRCARRAVDAAGRRPVPVAVRGAVLPDAADAQALLTALAVVVTRRSEQAWAAIALVDAGWTQARAAAALGISRQAVGQRLAAGLWQLERELRPTAARLLTRAAGADGDG